MTRVDDTSSYSVNETSFRCYALKQSLKLWVHEVMLDVVERTLDLSIKVRMLYHLLHDDCHIEENHNDAVATARHGGLGRKETRCSHHSTDVLELLQSLFSIFLAASSLGIFSHCYCTEALAEDITAFLNALTF